MSLIPGIWSLGCRISRVGNPVSAKRCFHEFQVIEMEPRTPNQPGETMLSTRPQPQDKDLQGEV
jgi:hypothetical protein